MRPNLLVPAACLLLLTGCGSNRNQTAADACGKAIADKLGGKTFSLDHDDMATHAKGESADVIALASTIVFDKGLSTEYRQTFDCRVRLENGKAADVIGLQFNWSKDDLKKANEQ
ncbi:MAG TPA: hypothetical protein VGH81_05505 [Rudaea sp.]|jgi:hypothetical protein